MQSSRAQAASRRPGMGVGEVGLCWWYRLSGSKSSHAAGVAQIEAVDADIWASTSCESGVCDGGRVGEQSSCGGSTIWKESVGISNEDVVSRRQKK